MNINVIIAITALALFLVASLTYGLAGVVGAFITVYALRAVLLTVQAKNALHYHIITCPYSLTSVGRLGASSQVPSHTLPC
ncbi:hypothetical protein JCM19239_567 [Vibrio variabilis]|uniref:Uncharacterized protein n=1 Tax=Vibrio variabilis TaxID=990271 RepID=A0ABQ0JA52_9VIBR|nr:hypothetical protein JCM19239_567 [Vibrio variabilis]